MRASHEMEHEPPAAGRRRAPRGVRLVAAALLVSAFPAAGAAAAADGDDTVALTVYSSMRPGAVPASYYRPGPGGAIASGDSVPGFAVVRLERTLELPAQRHTVRFQDVPALLDPTTVSFRSLTNPEGTQVLEQSFEFDLVDEQRLLQRYVDHEITVVTAAGDETETFTGRLLSPGPPMLLEGPDGTVRSLRQPVSVLYPALPGGLITRPTLVWDVRTRRPGRHRTRVTFQTDGITWWADYNLVFQPDPKDANAGTAELGAWVSLLNLSGGTYRDAKLKLIAGEVRRLTGPRRFLQARLGKGVAETEDAGFEEKAFFEYHLYTLGRPTTIPDRSTKQIELFPAVSSIPVRKTLVVDLMGASYPRGSVVTSRSVGSEVTGKARVFLEFKNRKAHGLGIPLPAGRVRVSQRDPADGHLEFIGEDAVGHTPRNERVRVLLGEAFDIVSERRQEDYKVDTRRRWMEETLTVQVRNRKETAAEVQVLERMFRGPEWKLLETSHPYTKLDAFTVQFTLKLPPDGEETIRYVVRYTW